MNESQGINTVAFNVKCFFQTNLLNERAYLFS